MVIFRAKLPQREKNQLSTPNIFRKPRHEFASSTATATSASQATPRDTKLSLRKCEYKIDIDTFQSAAYEGGKRKRDSATSVHLLWIAKQLTRSKNVMSHLALITNRSLFYVPIVPHDFCVLALSCLLC